MEKKVKDLVQGDIIIVQSGTYNKFVYKIEVLEKTQTSIYYEILDTGNKNRILLESFDNGFKIIEFLYNKTEEERKINNTGYWDGRLKEIFEKVNPNPLRQIYPDWTVRDYFRWNDKTDITITYR